MIKRKDKSKTRLEFNKRAVELFGTSKISYEQAKEYGLLLYWSGAPCKKGHLTYSYVSSGECRQCKIDRNLSRNRPDVPPEKEKNLKKNTDEIKYRLEMKKLEKEYSYDFD